MKYFAIILVLLLVALSACSSQQLPPEPVTPSSVGNYYKAVGEWAVEPLSFTLASPEQISCYAGNLVPITGFVTGDDFVYKNYYVWSQSLQGWYSDTYDSGDVVESTNWIRGDASFSDSILCEDLLEYADSTGEIYVVAYACSWDNSDWDCYDNKWQIQVFQVTEIAAPTCVDSDGGIEYTTQGSVVTNTETATDFCSGSSLTEYSCSPTNTLESVLYTCPDGCSAGECLPAPPVEPTGPSVTGVTFRTQSGSLITELTDGMTIDVSSYGSNIFNARADIVNTNRVTFALSGPLTISRTENVATYDLFGDGAGNIPSQGFSNGAYTLVVTPINTSSGVTGTPVSIDFTLTGIGSTPNPNPDPNPIVGDGGLFWNDALVQAWKDRAQNGPYISKGDAFINSPAEWERITNNALEFKANPSADRISSTEGWRFDVFETKLSNPDVINHIKLSEATLYALVNDDQDIKDKVKTELLWHATRDYLQLSPGFTYNPSVHKTDNNNWHRTEYFSRIIIAIDLLRNEFTSSELETMKNWLLPWARFYDEMINDELKREGFGNRYDRDYSNNLGYRANVECGHSQDEYTYRDQNGILRNEICGLGRLYNNRKSSEVNFFGLTGLLFNDSLLIDHAKLFFEEWLKFHVYADGSVSEAERDENNKPFLGTLLYGGSITQHMSTLGFGLYNYYNDPFFFEYETCDGLWGTEVGDGDACNTGETPKTLKLVIDTHFDLMEGRQIRYVGHSETDTSSKYRIDKEGAEAYPTYQWDNEMAFGPISNLYWKDPRITSSYKRESPGSVPLGNEVQVAGNSGSARLTKGSAAQFPSMSFMYAEMENIQSATSDGGLFWDDELVQAWKNRAQNGPFKSQGDTAGLNGYGLGQYSPGEWTIIQSNANWYRTNFAQERLNQEPNYKFKFDLHTAADVDPSTGRRWGAQWSYFDVATIKAVDAAFYALVTDDTQLANLVKKELLLIARDSDAQAPVNFVPSANVNTDHWNWPKGEYFSRVIGAMDFVRNSFSESEWQEMNDWLVPWAEVLEAMTHRELSDRFLLNRAQRDYSYGSLGTIGREPQFFGTNPKNENPIPWWSQRDQQFAYQDSNGNDKNQISAASKRYNNRRAHNIRFVGLAGALFDEPFLRDRAKLYVEEWLKFSVFPDGSTGEFERNEVNLPGLGAISYGGINLEIGLTLAFVFHRIGESELIFYTTREGLHGTESNSGESAKSLKLVSETMLDLIEGKKAWYQHSVNLNSPPSGNKENHRIDNIGEIPEYDGAQWGSDVYIVIANSIWDDQRLTQGYLRSASGSPRYYPSSIGPDGRNRMEGSVYDKKLTATYPAFVPSLLFMYAGLESVVN